VPTSFFILYTSVFFFCHAQFRCQQIPTKRQIALPLKRQRGMSYLQKLSQNKPNVRRNRWFERLMAIVAAVNLCLVFFDLSYVPWRDFYLREIPGLTQIYDPFKGIEPHRETQNYLNKVNQLEAQLIQTGLESPQTEELLGELVRLSNQMIVDNPFALANKSGTLEKIKNQIRDRVGEESAHRAFDKFWSQAYLSQGSWQQEVNFFNTKLRPLIQTNYYRRIGTNGKFINNFLLIDLPFVILFGLEFLVRTFSISRHSASLTWPLAMLRRWYDLFLLLPFWRWLRVIPVTIRLSQSDLLNLEPIRAQIKYDFIANFAEELTEIVGIRLINQAQESIKRGDVIRWLFHSERRHPYIDINNTDEVKAIAIRLLRLSIYEVLPKVQPDIETLLHHSVETILNQSPVYQQLQNVPGLNHLPNQLTQKLVTDISGATYSTLTTLLEDPVVAEHSNRLIQNFSEALQVEVQKKHNLQEIQALVVDMLEEIKINYVRGISEGGVEKILEEAEQLHQIIDR